MNKTKERIPLVEPETAQGAAKEMLDAIKAQRGRLFNLHKVLANSGVAITAYHHLFEDLDKGALPEPLRHKLAARISELHDSAYAIAAFTAIGKMNGVSDAEIAEARKGSSEDPKTQAALAFTTAVVEKRGAVGDADVEAMRAAGWNNSDIVEIVINITTYTFINYLALVTGIEVDFPPAPPKK